MAEKVPKQLGRMGRLSKPDYSLKNFIPPDYVWHRILMQGCLYSLTGPTGVGKTSIAMTIAAHVAQSKPLHGRATKAKRVLYLAGENPLDIMIRLAGMIEKDLIKADGETFFVYGTFNINEWISNLSEQIEKLGGVDLVIVDTAAAFFTGDNENDNMEQQAFGETLRSLRKLKGRPAILVLCHPIKTGRNNLPRGGGAFLATVDGNLTVSKAGTRIKFHTEGKFRGPPFEPMYFELRDSLGPLKDAGGELLPTIIAYPVEEDEITQEAQEADREADELWAVAQQFPGVDYVELAEHLGWYMDDGRPSRTRVSRAMRSLEARKLVKITVVRKGPGGSKWDIANPDAR